MAADRHGGEVLLSSAESGPAVGSSRVSEPPRPTANPLRNPPYPRQMSRLGWRGSTPSPQEASASTQYAPQYGRGASAIWGRSINHQPPAWTRQPHNDESLRESRSRNEAASHRQGQAGPTPVAHALEQRPHDPRLVGVSLGPKKCGVGTSRKPRFAGLPRVNSTFLTTSH